MRYFHKPDGAVPLVFAGATWSEDAGYDKPCPGGGTGHTNITAAYPLPRPSQDPIPVLTGYGHQEQTGACNVKGVDFNEKFVRTGD
ncbi:hypothetical protein [Mycobacterium sp. E2733]|uniref:hypothetical protein n=1 Tax=Mycobacterium sp. E2733 TaxID=1834138 RepID=UPI0007FD9A63|nr:hypothetical protein [Mycobacterium sp. E2733]OBH90943.1 hypothetical protein A5678_12100 [Mycobacterium sp. E2733]